MLADLIVVLFLIGVNALYVAAEFAAVSVRQSQIRQLAEEGNGLAVRFLPWIQDSRQLDLYVAACQIGITISSLLLGAYGQASLTTSLSPLFARWGGFQEVAAQSTAALTVLIGLTATQVILGELVPKSLALQFSSQMALLTFVPMRWSLTLFSWFITVLNGSGLAVLRLLRVPYGAHRHIHSPEEIEMLIAESRDGGVLEPDEHRRLHRALQLGVRPAHQLMVPRRFMQAIDIDTPVDQILHEIARSPYSHLPVYQGSVDNVIGILHAKDVVIRYLERGRIRSIQEIMRPIISVPENVTADVLLKLLRQRRSHQAVVVDEFGGTEGLVTLEDVLKEMLGEVADEFKTDQLKPETLPDGRVRLPGFLRLDETGRWLNVLWQGEADTIGGHVTEVLGYVPEAGERFTIHGIDVEIEQVEHHAIVSLLAVPAPVAVEGDHG